MRSTVSSDLPSTPAIHGHPQSMLVLLAGSRVPAACHSSIPSTRACPRLLRGPRASWRHRRPWIQATGRVTLSQSGSRPNWQCRADWGQCPTELPILTTNEPSPAADGIGPEAPTDASPRFHPLRADVLADPYPAYARMRERAPVVWDRRFGWLVFRYDDVAASLRDPRLSAHRPGPDDRIPRTLDAIQHEIRELRRLQGKWLLCADPPDHTRMRALLGDAFSPGNVQRMAARIQSVVDEVLDRADTAGGLDIVADLGYPLPGRIISELLGVPLNDLDLVKRWSDDLAGSFTYAPETMHRAYVAITQLTEYMDGLARRSSRSSSQTVLDVLIGAREADAMLDKDDLVAQAVMLLFAGHETTTGLIANGTLALLRHPDQAARMRAEPLLIDTAIDELLRFDSPTQATFRSVAEDCELRGQHLRKGDPVLLMLGSANRDPCYFDRPDMLDIGRRDNRHLAFSQGVHFCLRSRACPPRGSDCVGGVVQALRSAASG